MLQIAGDNNNRRLGCESCSEVQSHLFVVLLSMLRSDGDRSSEPSEHPESHA